MDIIASTDRERKRIPSKSLRKNPSYLAWVKAHVSEIDLGLAVQGGGGGCHPIHLNKNEQVLDHFERLHNGARSWLKHRWSTTKIRSHTSGDNTYYFAGAPEQSKRRTLLMVDVDCKRRGTPEGARAFLAYLASDDCAQKYGLPLPGLYIESSTHGRGGHGFLLLDKWNFGAEIINRLFLDRLQPFLNRIAEEKAFDIEFVEIKGTLPVIEWGQQKFDVRSYKSGCLAKLPREGENRFDEFRRTSVISVFDLLRLPASQKMAAPKEASALAIDRDAPTCSISGNNITKDMLAALEEGGRYRVVTDRLLGSQKMRTSGRQVIRTEDVAIFLMLGEWFTTHMLLDGTMPENRWEGLWRRLKLDRDIDRGWCHKRFKIIRDWLSSLGLLDWEDPTYRRGWYDAGGSFHRGKAAKWRFSKDLMEMLEDPQQRRSAADNGEAETRGKSDGDGRVGAGPDNEEEEEHPLWEHNLQDLVRQTGLGKMEKLGCFPFSYQLDGAIVRPIERARDDIYLFNPDEITRLIAPFEAFVA